ncbi:PAS domain-containing sensor histidine kinase [Flavobacterium sp.]|uniref:sensor histidine kinase n=1 Tax=Flavobacterium sp. TaxID=239 RepID=UPI002B4AF3BE|nr:PAS domain-containing sensor histidine kinase [Flavobacterium sp.]HLF53102.1 PAS domain-containing sensor histidine kinase [Flavobacterium sp.]
MEKNIKELLEEIEKLNKGKAKLQQQLLKARETIDLIKTANIDALVVTDKEKQKVFTEITSDKTYRILIEKMHEGAVTLDKEGIILYCNSCFANMVNMPLQKVIGTKFKNYIVASSQKQYAILFEQGWSVNSKDEIFLDTNNGKVMPVLMSANSMKLDDIYVLSVIVTDVTIRNENQEELKNRTEQLQKKNLELENVNKALAIQNEEKKKRTVELSCANKGIIELEKLIAHKESILTILSHDLRSPLSGIIGTTEFLKTNFEEMEHSEVKTMLDLLYESSKDELNMLDYLVEWARIKYASEAFTPSKIELAKYVNKVFEILSDIAAVNTINLHHEIEENTKVFADKKMLISVLQNIVSNAIKHSIPGGTITVSTKRKDDKIIVEIKDTGTGMTKEIQEKLFTPQMEALSKEREDSKGAGIGLLLVKGLLEKNSGEIWVESTLGFGSSFYFTLPIEKPLQNKLSKQIPV